MHFRRISKTDLIVSLCLFCRALQPVRPLVWLDVPFQMFPIMIVLFMNKIKLNFSALRYHSERFLSVAIVVSAYSVAIPCKSFTFR